MTAESKHHTYFNGDKAEYTGKTADIYGSTCYECKIVEGHKVGKLVWTYRAPGDNSLTANLG